MSRQTELKLNLGCGLVAPETWVNIDGSWNAKLAKLPFLRRLLHTLHVLTKEDATVPWPKNIRVHNVAKGLPFPDNSVSAIYSSRLLEHLTHRQARRLLEDALRVLAPGGIIRLQVPDLHDIVLDYLDAKKAAAPGDPRPAEALIRTLGAFRGYDAPLIVRLRSALTAPEQHKWFYDYDSLTSLMVDAGFTNVRRCAPLDSAIADIGVLERASKKERKGAMCVEAVKPNTPTVHNPSGRGNTP